MLRTRIRGMLAAVVVAALALVGLVAAPAYAADITRIVSGHVYLGDASRSAVADEVTITATSLGGYPTYTANTDASGNYSLAITTNNPNIRTLLTFTYNGAENFSSGIWPNYPIGANSGARHIDLTSADKPNTDMTMPRPVTVSGQVLLAPALTPAGGGTVAVTWERMNAQNTGFGPESAPVLVDADGRYSFSLPGGYYYFRYVYVGAGGGYAELPFTSPGTNSPVQVFDQNVPLTTKTMYLEDSINGRVGLGLTGSVYAGAGDVRVTPNFRANPTDPWTRLDAESVLTDASGRFMITDAADGYYTLNYEWIGSPAGAYANALEAGAFTYFIDHFKVVSARLSRLGSISGQVFLGDASHPAGTGDVEVSAGSRGFPDSFRGHVQTDATGHYTITGLHESSMWVIRFEYLGDDGYGDVYSDDTALGATDVTGLDAILPEGEGLGGHVTDSSDVPLEDVLVTLHAISQGGGHSTLQTTTDANGEYRFRGLDTEHFYALEYELDGYAFQTFFNSGEFYQPDFILLNEDEILTDVDTVLYRPVTISGVVKGVGAGPIGAGIPAGEFTAGNVAVNLQVWDYYSGKWVETPYWEGVAADGTYTMDELPPDDYRLQASYYGEHGEASVRSSVLELEEGDSATFSAQLRPYLRDVSGDYIPDVLGRGVTGNLVMYKGNPNGTLGTSTVIGTGWNVYNAMVQAGDIDLDGDADLIARDTTGRVFLYKGLTAGGIESARTQIASGWKAYTYVLSPGDVDSDGYPDMMTLDTAGKLWLHPGNGMGGLGTRVQVSSGWSGPTAFVTPGDFDLDGYPDLIVRDRSGFLWLYRGNSAGTFSNVRTKIGSGWQNATAIFSVGDLDGDWNPDLLGRGKTGSLYSYAGSGAGTLGPAHLLNSGWQKAVFVL